MNSFEKQKMRAWLIKQRDGLIIGEYRNQMCMLFKGIEALCSTSDYCTIDQLQNYFKNTMFDKLTILSEDRTNPTQHPGMLAQGSPSSKSPALGYI